MNRRRIVVTLLLACLAYLAFLPLPVFAHGGHGKGEVAPYDLDTPRKVSPETAAHIGLQTAEVDFGAVEEVLRLTGVVRAVPDRIRAVAARIGGTAVRVAVQVGDTVRAGEVLVEIDSPELARNVYELRALDTRYLKLQGEVAGARSRIAELQVQAQEASERASIVEAEYARLQENTAAVAVNLLGDRQAAALRSRSEAKLREIELELARRQAESMEQQAVAMQRSKEALAAVIDLIRHDSAGAEPDRAGLVRLAAPMDGVVIERTLNAGEGVTEGQMLLEIADYSRVQIEGELPESLVERLGAAADNPVRIRRISATSGEPIGTGRVRFVSPVIDPIKRTTHVLVQADNPGGLLRDGMYVDLSIVLREQSNAVVVPASAVVTSGPMQFVFLKDGEFYRKQDINPGARDDRVLEVVDGVLPGDVVVIRGAYSLTQLRPARPPAAPPAGTAAPAAE